MGACKNNVVNVMEITGIWSQFFLNLSTVTISPNISIQGILINPVPSEESYADESINEDPEEIVETPEISNQSDEKNCNSENTETQKLCQRVRYSKEEYHCTQCPYRCTTEKAFFKHSRWCHTKNTEVTNQPLSCPICGKDRQNKDALALHMEGHQEDKYFCCDICPKFKSLQLKKLIQHRRMHTGEKPHLCPWCTYRSSRRDNLRSHARRVHKKNNFNCNTFTPRSIVICPRLK